MPVISKVLREGAFPLRFCRSASPATATSRSRWFLVAAEKCVLWHSGLQTAQPSEATGLPQISGHADETLSFPNDAKPYLRTLLGRGPLRSLCVVLSLAISYAMAGAQTASNTTLSVNPASAANGSVFTMTAIVKAGATSLTGGTITFRDTYGSVTQTLGTVQVQSANGTKGNAVLHQQLGGIGTHSIVATFNATKAYSNSSSATQIVTVTGLYPTTASLTSTGVAGNYSLTTTIVGTGSLNLSPSGNVSIFDTSNSNYSLGSPGLGAGTFGQQTVSGSTSPVTVGNSPLGVAAGDFNNNGNIDIVVLNSGDNTTSILNGNGAGGFTASGTTRTTGNGPIAIVAGDFDGDGNLDFAVANSIDKTIWVRLGNGDSTFSNHTTYSVSLLTITSIAVGDFNGDGIPDIAVAGATLTGGAVDILQGDGTGAFSNVTPLGIAVGNGPSCIVTGDFNGDGNLDFAVANLTDNTISVMRGNGSGTTFTAAAGSPFSTGVGTSPAAIAVADFNGGGQLDLAVAESNAKRVDIFKGNGDGTFSLFAGAPTTGNKPVSIVAGDFNADGKVDFAVTNKSDNTVTIMLGNGIGTVFTAATSSPFTVGATPVAITLADFNGDGSADLGVANSGSSNVSILLNQVTDTASVSIANISVPGSGTNHTIQASYAGDSNFAASSKTMSLQSSNITTATLLSANTTSPTYGQQVVLTASIQPSLLGSLTPTGNVKFKDGNTTIGTVAVSGGVATLNITSLALGTHSITATYAGDTNFLTSASSALGTIVSKTVPVITWATPSPISYVTLLSTTQLNATTTVPGTFAYSQPVYTLLAAGTYTLNVTFTPTDSTSYTTASSSVTLVVNPATPQINWPSPAPITFGTGLSGIQLNATVAVYDMVSLSSYYNVYGI
ncbi:MAG: repeat protein, partial [Edaphobacter sp.]|nr:repeat protein [Edaphobacter sp.]